MTDVLDRLNSKDRARVLAAMDAHVKESIRYALEEVAPRLVAAGMYLVAKSRLGEEVDVKSLGENVLAGSHLHGSAATAGLKDVLDRLSSEDQSAVRAMMDAHADALVGDALDDIGPRLIAHGVLLAAQISAGKGVNLGACYGLDLRPLAEGQLQSITFDPVEVGELMWG